MVCGGHQSYWHMAPTAIPHMRGARSAKTVFARAVAGATVHTSQATHCLLAPFLYPLRWRMKAYRRCVDSAMSAGICRVIAFPRLLSKKTGAREFAFDRPLRC